jgi:mannose-6-phosphate isomerase-like protein (cupin superfamily)
MTPRAHVVQLDALPALRCPCGFARRAFADEPGAAASMHLVDIETDSQVHHHRETTELYLVLEGTGEIELDGRRFPVKPLTAISIPPGVRHRAIGRLRIVNVPVPAFNEADEWVD